MPQKEGRDEAIRRAKAALARAIAADEAERPEGASRRCSRLGLPAPVAGAVDFRLFGSPARLELSTLALAGEGGEERSQTDRILFYHYFASEGVIQAGGELVSFRDFSGGAFYWEPFRSRTSVPLAAKYGDDFATLRLSLERFDWSELALGDFGARIHGFGNLYLSLVAYRAEEGLASEISVLFDPAVKRVFMAEDAAAFASRICMGLL
jgi:hypothetical protein